MIVSIGHTAMSQKLQMDPQLTEFREGHEDHPTEAAVKEQQGQLKQLKEGNKGNPLTIEEVRTGQPQTGGGGASQGRDKSLRYRKGGARGTQPKIQGGAKSG